MRSFSVSRISGVAAGNWVAERRNRGYTIYRAGSGTPIARLRPTGQNDRVEVLYWSLWKQRWTSGGPFGRTILTIDEALRFIASEDIFWAVRQPPIAECGMRKVQLRGYHVSRPCCLSGRGSDHSSAPASCRCCRSCSRGEISPLHAKRGYAILLGLAITFGVVASLATVGSGWVVEANYYGRIATRDRPEPGGATVGLVGDQGEMKWRVVMEVTGADGAVGIHEIGGGARIDEYSPRSVGLTLAEGKLVLAGLHLSSRSSTDGRSLPPPAAMPAVRNAAADQGQAIPTSCVFVRYRECFRAPVRAMPLRRDSPPDPEPGQRDHGRPVHTGVRAGCREDGSFTAITGVPGRCCRSFCRSTTFLRWRQPANARSAWAPGWKRKPSHWLRWQNQP